jgi:two-component system, NarL family, nitrate/nitrite response regulator NarL
MTRILTPINQRGRLSLPMQLPGEININNDLLKLIFQFLLEINEIKQDESWISPNIADSEQKVIFKATIQDTCYILLCSQTKPENKNEQIPLSPREYEIVRLASRGMSNKTIAAVLDISQWTVNTYIRRIFSKLGVNSRVEMVAVITKSGLTDGINEVNDQKKTDALEFQKLINYFFEKTSVESNEVRH